MTIAIIGGTSGIGKACAALWLAQGAEVVIFGRDEARLTAALAELEAAAFGGGVTGASVTGSCVDAADAEALEQALAQVSDLEVLVVSVGAGAGGGTLDSLGRDGLKAGFEQKVFPVWNAVQAGRKHLSQYGALVILGAARAHYAAPDGVGLAAVHGALAAMIPSLAKALAPIRVTLVAPGVTDTPPWEGMGAERKAAVFSHFADQTLVGRVGQPEDVAAAVVSLATNTYVTGQVLCVDGGLSV